MNRSGQVLPWLQRKTGVDANHLLVAVDNMDLPVGEIRMKTRGGPAQHNGLRSVSATLGSDDFARIYIGIGRPNEGVSVTDHVLSAPDADEQRLIHDAIDRAVPILDKAPVHEFDDLVRRINDVRRPAE
jgi:PTH1 family peptidyl-tRNA hydrolase